MTYTNNVGNGWQLVSVPFPSPILVTAPLPGFDAQMQFWQSSGSYAGTYQAMMPGPNSVIPAMQGFFVRTTSNADFTLPQSYRTLGDPNFYREHVQNTLRLELQGNGFADKTVVKFGSDGQSNLFDAEFDANKIKVESDQPCILTRIEEDEYAINALPYQGFVNPIPMDFYPGRSGIFKIEANDLMTMEDDRRVYLEDLQTGIFQELNASPKYEFHALEGDDPRRFLLHFRFAAEENAEQMSSVAIYASNSQVHLVIGSEVVAGRLDITDAMGRLVHTDEGNFSGNQVFNLSHLSTGHYVVRAFLDGQSHTKKVVL